MSTAAKIICVSNRLPVSATDASGSLEFQPSSGGLVTAVGPILRRCRGVWIGWPGTSLGEAERASSALAAFSEQSDFQLTPVFLDSSAIENFYNGFSNQIIWPLFHDLQTRCNFDPPFWEVYASVQHLFADAAKRAAAPGDLIWIHDYHLMGVGRALRSESIANKLCFFFHIPFPAPDIFSKLPWRDDVIDALMHYDLIGFQTKRDLRNFVDCLEQYGQVTVAKRGDLVSIKNQERAALSGAFPISIDFSEFSEAAQSEEVAQAAKLLRSDMNVEHLILSIDRLDYTKGIPYRIKAFKRLIETEPGVKKRIALLQVLVPSRVEVPEYQVLRGEVEQLVTQVNGEIGEPGWMPVHHLFRSMTREEVIAMYRAADVALVTPLKDGMNLVAKEYCASRVLNDGALVLSEFAGAADEFADLAFLVNPYDIDGVAHALHQAISLSKDDAEERMLAMRRIVKSADVFRWAESFLNAVGWEWPSVDAAPRPATIWDRLRRITNVFDI